MADDLAEQLRAELIRTSVGHEDTVSVIGESVAVTLPVSHLSHFADILVSRGDDIEVRLLLDPTDHLVGVMKEAPDMWTWGAEKLLRRRRHDDKPTEHA